MARQGMARPSLRSAFGLHLAATTGLGLALLVLAVTHLRAEDLHAMGPGFWLVAVLLVAAEVRPVVASGSYDPEGVTLSSAFIFAILFHWGPAVALVMQAVTTAAGELAKHKAWWRVSFNVGQYVICLGVGAGVLWVFGDLGTPTDPMVFAAHDLSTMFLAWVAYFVTNLVLVGRILSLHRGTSFREEMLADFWYYAVTAFAVLVLSPVFVVVISTVWQMVPLLLLPLFLVYKTASISREKEHQSLHDGLTGLPNRKLLVEAVEEALQDSVESGRPLALCLLDLDRFKEVNDTLGHQSGDRLLEIAAARLTGTLRPGDVVARLGGDEFAVLLTEVESADAALEVACRMRAAVCEPYHLDGMLLEVAGSVVVAMHPAHGSEVEELLRSADVAMYQAKETRGGVELYSPERDVNTVHRLALLSELRRGIESGALVLHYQPKVALPSRSVVGVEALVRWERLDGRLAYPDEFLELAEQAGMMRQLTASVLDQALAQAARWWGAGWQLPVAVNVSVRDLTDAGFVDHLAEGLRRHRLPAEAVVLEITEHVLMADPTRSAAALDALAARGVRLSLDDFGTGYSSLVHLRRLPVSEIKVDRSFVSRMVDEPDDASIVRSIVDLGHALGLHVVAEGVEDEPTWTELCALGVDSAQGWLVSRGVPAAELTTWLEGHSATAEVAVDVAAVSG
jgi:diguanylate cyclase (GGDEF)-like protein